MSLDDLNQMFRDYLEYIMYTSTYIDDAYDRVTVMQWIRKLQCLDDKSLEIATLRNQYMEYLRMMLDNEHGVHLGPPFKDEPPEEHLRPLCEVLANYVAKNCPPIPMTGPMEPVMSQTSPDGRVFTVVKQCPDGGIYCYLAVTNEQFEDPN